MAKKKLYKVGRVTMGEANLYLANRLYLEKKHAAARALYREFQEFTTLNGYGDQPIAERLLRYCSTLEFWGYDPGTIVGRLRTLRSEIRRGGSYSISQVEAIYGERKTKTGTWRAKDHSSEDLIETMSSWPSCEERTQLALILLNGCRNIDLAGTGGMVVTPSRVSADVIISKTRKRTEDRATLDLRPPFCILSAFPTDIISDLIAWSRRASGTTEQSAHRVRRVFTGRKTAGTGVILHFLRRHNFPGTTYSFRRAYIHRTITLCTDADGSVDWAKVTERTLHFDPKLVKSVYAKMIETE